MDGRRQTSLTLTVAYYVVKWTSNKAGYVAWCRTSFVSWGLLAYDGECEFSFLSLGEMQSAVLEVCWPMMVDASIHIPVCKSGLKSLLFCSSKWKYHLMPLQFRKNLACYFSNLYFEHVELMSETLFSKEFRPALKSKPNIHASQLPTIKDDPYYRIITINMQ